MNIAMRRAKTERISLMLGNVNASWPGNEYQEVPHNQGIQPLHKQHVIPGLFSYNETSPNG